MVDGLSMQSPVLQAVYSAVTNVGDYDIVACNLSESNSRCHRSIVGLSVRQFENVSIGELDSFLDCIRRLRVGSIAEEFFKGLSCRLAGDFSSPMSANSI